MLNHIEEVILSRQTRLNIVCGCNPGIKKILLDVQDTNNIKNIVGLLRKAYTQNKMISITLTS